ncbi:MAG: hypothetical protein ACHBN1_15930 [Heteroscytonema crispum UTEX LB 1556]
MWVDLFIHLEAVKMQIKDMTVDELKALIRETVEETLEDFFGDPDEGKEVQQLLESLKRRKAGVRGIPAEEVYKKLGLNSQ